MKLHSFCQNFLIAQWLNAYFIYLFFDIENCVAYKSILSDLLSSYQIKISIMKDWRKGIYSLTALNSTCCTFKMLNSNKKLDYFMKCYNCSKFNNDCWLQYNFVFSEIVYYIQEASKCLIISEYFSVNKGSKRKDWLN